MPLITDKDIQDINSALAELAPYTEAAITYKTYVSTTPANQKTGTQAVDNYATDATVTGAMVQELTLEQIMTSGGAYEAGDVEFTVRRTTKPLYTDRIQYDGVLWRPKEIRRPPLNGVNLWTIIATKKG